MVQTHCRVTLSQNDKFVECLNPSSYCFLNSACDADQKDQFLSRVEGLIMATDMSRHGEFLAKLQAAVEGAAAGDHPTQRLTSVPRTLLAELLIKCADASNVLRPVSVAKRWAVSCPHPAERKSARSDDSTDDTVIRSHSFRPPPPPCFHSLCRTSPLSSPHLCLSC